MRQHILSLKHRAAETAYPHTIAINQSAAVEFVNGCLHERGKERTFLGSVIDPHNLLESSFVIAIAKTHLQHKETLVGQGLGRIGGRKRPIDPETLAAFSMGLDDQGIPCSGFVAGWVVQFTPGRLCVTSLPVNHFDAAESELRELGVE